jgi:hypothetical protein
MPSTTLHRLRVQRQRGASAVGARLALLPVMTVLLLAALLLLLARVLDATGRAR